MCSAQYSDSVYELALYNSWYALFFLKNWCKNANFETSQAKPPAPKRRSDVFRFKVDLRVAPH